MEPVLRTDLARLLAAAEVTQAAFARLAGVTARQVNNWARGRAPAPRWALVLAALLQDASPDALAMTLEEARLRLAEGFSAGRKTGAGGQAEASDTPSSGAGSSV